VAVVTEAATAGVPLYPSGDATRLLLKSDPLPEHRTLGNGLVAFGIAGVIGVGLDLVWLHAAPPHALAAEWSWVGVTLVSGSAVCALYSSAVRRSVMAWRAAFAATLWGLLTIGWVVVFPGTKFGLGGLAFFGIGATAGFVAFVVLLGSRYRARSDFVCGVVIVLVAVLTISVTGAEFGRHLRLSLVRDRYERAIHAGRVEAEGGFRHANAAGWVWTDGVPDPVAAMVFDATDDLERLTHPDAVFVAAVGEMMRCTRFETNWYWCEFH